MQAEADRVLDDIVNRVNTIHTRGQNVSWETPWSWKPRVFWEELFQTVSPVWVEAHQKLVLSKYYSYLADVAAHYYKQAPIRWVMIYHANYEQTLLANPNPFFRSVSRHEKNGKRYIYVEYEAVLSVLYADRQWKYTSADGSPNISAVRFGLTYFLKRLFSKPNFYCVYLDRKYTKGAFPHQSAHQIARKLTHNFLPVFYPSMLRAKIERHKFFQQYPYLASMRTIVWPLYKVAGDDLICYLNRALDFSTLPKPPRDRELVLRQRVHDALYMFEDALSILTPSAAKRLLSLCTSADRARKYMECIQQVRHAVRESMNLKEQRKLFRRLLLQDAPMTALQAYLSDLESEQNDRILERLMVDRDWAERFISRMRKYADITLKQFMDTLRMDYDLAKKIMDGNMKGLFRPETIPMPLNYIGEEIRRALGNKGYGAQVNNPKKLYHHLSQLGDVRRMIKGEIPEPERVLKMLRHFGLKMSHMHEAAIRLRAVVEPKASPEYLVAGNASVCCMSWGSPQALQYAIEEGFGVLNIYFGDRIVANSVLWINQLPIGRALVLDNIEVAPNYLDRLKVYLKGLYMEAVPRLMRRYQCFVAVQGMGYNDLYLPVLSSLPDTRIHECLTREWTFHPIGICSLPYTDAHQVRPVALLTQYLEFTTPREMRWDGERSLLLV